MIHEVHPWMTTLNFDQKILSFDDGLQTQYEMISKFPINNKKILFPIVGFINDKNLNKNLVSCREALRKAYCGNTEHYLNFKQLDFLINSGIEIGGHSFSHRDIRQMTFVESVEYLKKDTEQMFIFFEKYKININFFCFPFNYDSIIYRTIVKQYNSEIVFVGKNREPIENLRK